MKPDPHSAEFADLIGRWLDQTATAEEAERLWQAVGECPECAREFAMSARFEALLGAAVAERAAEKKLIPALPEVVTPTTLLQPVPPRRVTVWLQPEFRSLMATAALVAISFLSVFFWPDAPEGGPVAASHETVAPIPQPPLRRLKKQAEDGAQLGQRPQDQMPRPASDPVPLVHHLDRFFLTGVSLEKVPLSRAIGILQGQLREVNYEDKLMLDQLRVLVPTDAAQRRVTLHCGPIPFLKAVRAVAALAGCDVIVSEPQITITIQQSIYPQLAEKRVLSDMLAGRLTADGKPLVDDAVRLAALSEDAATLGVALQADGTVAMTRGQWEALKMLTETRDYIGTLPVPMYGIYAITKEDTEDKSRALTPGEVNLLKQHLNGMGVQPLLTFTPQLASLGNHSPIRLEPLGDTIATTISNASNPSESGPAVGWNLIGTDDGSFVGGAGTLSLGTVGAGALLTFNGSASGTNVDGATNTTNRVFVGAGALSSNAQAGGAFSPKTVTVRGSVSAEIMAQAQAYADSVGATLVLLPVDPP